MEYKKHRYTLKGLSIWRNLEIEVGNCKFCCKLEAAIDQKREEMKGSGRRGMFILIFLLCLKLLIKLIFNVMMQKCLFKF